jgi:hypothetical protein
MPLTRSPHLRDESGASAVLFIALASFVFVVFTFFVLNLSKTHEHQRHLQVQVDDGALATASFFTGCFQAPAVANANIAREAHRFSGDPTYPTNYDASDPAYPTPYSATNFPGPYNVQVQNTPPTVNGSPSDAQVQIGLNKPTYGPYSGYTDFDPTYDLRPDLNGVQNLPCDSDILDVKATDLNIPARFGGFLPSTSVTVKARARVEIKKVKLLSGFLPWAVPEVRPKAVLAIFVNELSGAVSGVQLLNDSNTTPTLNGTPVELWNADAQFIGHSQSGTGVVVGISGNALASPPSGTLAQICGLAKMTCYAGSSTTSGLWYIQGFTNGTGSVASPVLGSVTLQQATCGDDSSPYFILNGDCTIQIRAPIDFGTGAGDPTRFPTCASASVNGTPMTWAGGIWTASAAITIPDSSGRNTFNISWSSGHRANANNCNGQQPNSGNFNKVAAPYAADSASGPVDYVAVTGSGGAFLGSLGTSTNTPNTVHVAVGLEPPLHVAVSNTEKPILLRFASGHGSKTQALLCDFGKQLEDMVRDGCQTNYAVNERGEVCSGGTPPGPTWDNSNLPPRPFPPPQPNPAPDCIQFKTGQVTAMAKGLKARFESPCTDNNWIAFRNNYLNGLPNPFDKRYVSLVVADASSFGGNGLGQLGVIPIRVFAGFYVTGWFVTGNGPGTSGCPQNDPHPLGYAANSPKASGDVWGYFVTSVILGSTGPSNEFCKFNEIGLCFASLTQ